MLKSNPLCWVSLGQSKQIHNCFSTQEALLTYIVGKVHFNKHIFICEDS